MAIQRLHTRTDPPTYDAYCNAVTASFHPRSVTALSVPAVLLRKIDALRRVLEDWAVRLKLSLSDLEACLKSKQVFKLLAAVRFNVKRVLSALQQAARLIPAGLQRVVHELSDTETFKRLRAGGEAVDAFLARHPVLKHMTSLAVAGLLLWLWFNASFVGDPDFDFDLSIIAIALYSDAPVTLLFSSDAMQLIALSIVGMSTGLSIPWLGSDVANLAAAVLLTGAKHLRKTSVYSKLRASMERSRV